MSRPSPLPALAALFDRQGKAGHLFYSERPTPEIAALSLSEPALPWH